MTIFENHKKGQKTCVPELDLMHTMRVLYQLRHEKLGYTHPDIYSIISSLRIIGWSVDNNMRCFLITELLDNNKNDLFDNNIGVW